MTDKTTDTTVDNPTPYRGGYKALLDRPDEDEAELTQGPDKDTQDEANLSPEEKTFKKRYGDLRSYSDKKLKELQAELEAERKKNAEAANAYKPPKTEEDVKKWIEAYPETGALVESLAYEVAKKNLTPLQEKIKELELQKAKAIRDKAEVELLNLHPDFPEISQTEEFQDWAQKQPKKIQEMLFDNYDDPVLAAKAIDLYKVEAGLISKPNKTTDRKSAAMDVDTRTKRTDPTKNSKKIWTVAEIQKLRPAEFEKYEAEIELAQQEGRIRG